MLIYLGAHSCLVLGRGLLGGPRTSAVKKQPMDSCLGQLPGRREAETLAMSPGSQGVSFSPCLTMLRSARPWSCSHKEGAAGPGPSRGGEEQDGSKPLGHGCLLWSGLATQVFVVCSLHQYVNLQIQCLAHDQCSVNRCKFCVPPGPRV